MNIAVSYVTTTSPCCVNKNIPVLLVWPPHPHLVRPLHSSHQCHSPKDCLPLSTKAPLVTFVGQNAIDIHWYRHFPASNDVSMWWVEMASLLFWVCSCHGQVALCHHTHSALSYTSISVFLNCIFFWKLWKKRYYIFLIIFMSQLIVTLLERILYRKIFPTIYTMLGPISIYVLDK